MTWKTFLWKNVLMQNCSEENNVVVVGGCGHVGLPFAVACSQHYSTIGLDINHDSVKALNACKLPFVEEGLQIALDYAVTRNKIHFTVSKEYLTWATFVAVTIGTPVDEEGNPRLDDIIEFFKKYLHQLERAKTIIYPSLPDEVFIMLRSTVSPGTTEIIRQMIADKNLGRQIYIAFCPERSAQGVAFKELHTLPQIIGTSDLPVEAAKKFAEFYWNIGSPFVVHMTSKEAEVAKLVTNMTRYVNFALANEFYMLADKFGVNINNIIDGAKYEYPRLEGLPTPGPNVGGPCLFKDGKFLLKNAFFPGLISTAFAINEGMPAYIWEKALEMHRQGPGASLKKIAILGMTFKKDNDDTRNSLSFKLQKIIKAAGYEVVTHDPYLPETLDNYEKIKECQMVFVMTPHSWYNSKPINIQDCAIVVDPWKLFARSQDSDNGIWRFRI